jgi:DNA-binding NtrC family response regulator
MSALQETQPPTGPRAVLVVSGEPAVTKLCQSVLQEAAFAVLSADGSSEALKICAQHQGSIELLLTDLILPPPDFQIASSSNQFPHVHGYDLAIRATAIRPGLRVILMCRDREKELSSHGISRTTLPILTRPFERNTLARLVQEVLSQPPPVLDRANQGNAANDAEWFD